MVVVLLLLLMMMFMMTLAITDLVNLITMHTDLWGLTSYAPVYTPSCS
jgi:hypothetical protein